MSLPEERSTAVLVSTSVARPRSESSLFTMVAYLLLLLLLVDCS